VVDVAAFVGATNNFHVTTMREVRHFEKYHVPCLTITFGYAH
jgi:hypothetical protein